jgi:hypothetical protein
VPTASAKIARSSASIERPLRAARTRSCSFTAGSTLRMVNVLIPYISCDNNTYIIGIVDEECNDCDAVTFREGLRAGNQAGSLGSMNLRHLA